MIYREDINKRNELIKSILTIITTSIVHNLLHFQLSNKKYFHDNYNLVFSIDDTIYYISTFKHLNVPAQYKEAVKPPDKEATIPDNVKPSHNAKVK